MAVDSSQNLFVADTPAHKVYEIKAGSDEPTLTIGQNSMLPRDVAVDSQGDVYVADEPSNGASVATINIYKSGQTSPFRKLRLVAAQGLAAVAVSSTGDLYVTYVTTSTPHTQAVTIFTGHRFKKRKTLYTTAANWNCTSRAIDLDAKGNVLLGCFSNEVSGPIGVGVFPPGVVTPTKIIAGGSGLALTFGFTLSSDQKTLYSNCGTPQTKKPEPSTSVCEFDYPSGKQVLFSPVSATALDMVLRY